MSAAKQMWVRPWLAAVRGWNEREADELMLWDSKIYLSPLTEKSGARAEGPLGLTTVLSRRAVLLALSS